MSARGFLGAGDLYIARYNPNTAQFDALKGPYECSKFEIKPKVDLKEMASKSRDGYGQVVESVAIQQPAEFTVELPEVNKESLTIALLGTSSVLNVGAGTVVDEVAVAKLDSWTELAQKNLSATGFAVKDSAGTTTYVLGTDYEVNYRMGMVKALSGGAITDAASLKVSYAHNAISGTMIAGATNAQIRARFVLDGKNFADDLPCQVEVYEAIIAADSAFDFLSDNFNKVSLPGKLKTPTGKSEPFVVKLLDTAA